MDMTFEIVEMIREGDLDNDLGNIETAIRDRRKEMPCEFCHLVGTHASDCAKKALEPRKDDEDKQIPEWFRKGGQIPEGFHKDGMVKVIGKLRPNYLFGHEFLVTKVNPKTVEIWVPDLPKYRRFAGQKTRIPKNALEVVA